MASDFPTTSRTLFERMHSGSPSDSTAALEAFFSRYWYPLYVFLRAQGETHHDAADLVQSFVVGELLTGEQLGKWDPGKGKLRTFLKVILDRYRKKEYRKENAAKRGGDKAATHISMDLEWARSDFQSTAMVSESPEVCFFNEWAAAAVAEASSRLATAYFKKGKQIEFQLLMRHLHGRGEDENFTYREIAEQLGISENVVKQRMLTLKARFKQEFRSVVRQTVREEDLDEEANYLLSLLSE